MGGQEGKPIVLFYPRGSASVKRTSPAIQVAHPVLRYSRRISALMAGTGAPPGTEPARTTTCHIGKFVPAATLQRWQMSGYSTSRTNSRVRTGNIGLHHLHHLARW